MRLPSYHRRISFFLAIALLMLIAGSPAVTSAQDDALDQVRRFPAEFIGHGNVELALAQIEWLHTRSRIGSVQLADREKKLKLQIEELFAQRASLVESLPLEFRFADDRARSEAVSRCLQELLAVRLDLASQSALLENEQSEEQEGKLKLLNENRSKIKNLDITLTEKDWVLKQTQDEFLAGDVTAVELDAVKREIKLLEADYKETYETLVRLNQELAAADNPDDLQYLRFRLDRQRHALSVQQKQAAVDQAQLAVEHSMQLQEKGFVTPEQVTNDKLALKNAQNALEAEKLNYSYDIVTLGLVPVENRGQTKIHREFRVLQAREKAAKSFLEQLNTAAISNQQIRRLDEEIEVKRREQALLSEQQFELQREVDEMEILEKQVRANLKKHLDSEAGHENKDPADKD